MSNLVESIISGDYTVAKELFEDRIGNIKERKMYEKKRMVAAEMDEAMGGKSIAQARADIEARGMTPRKASDVLQDPKDRSLPPIGSKSTVKTKKKKVSEATEKSTAGIRGAMQSSDPDVAGAARKKAGLYRAAIALSGKKGLGGKKAPKVKFMPKEKPVAQRKAAPSTPKDKDKTGYADTPTGRNRKRADDIAAKNPPGSAGLKIAKGIGKVAGFIARDIVGSIPG